MIASETPTADRIDDWSLSRAGARRSLILCVVGAIAGLVIAGFGLFTAQGTRTSTVPPEDAAVVNQIPILMADYLQQLHAIYEVDLARATKAQKEKILDDMIREELYVQRGIELGMANDDIDVRATLVTATEAQTAADATNAGATEAELRGYFDRHQATYAGEGTIELGDWLVPQNRAGDGERIAAAIRAGASLQSQSLTSSKLIDDGQEYYFAARAHLGEPLFAVARRLHDGEVGIATISGQTHILVVKHNAIPTPARFEMVRDHVLSDYIRDRVAEVERANGRFLRKRADIKIAATLQ
jgi:hypothetical protein